MTEITIYSSLYDCQLSVVDRDGTIIDEDGNEVGVVDMQKLMNAPESAWDDIIEEAVDELDPPD